MQSSGARYQLGAEALLAVLPRLAEDVEEGGGEQQQARPHHHRHLPSTAHELHTSPPPHAMPCVHARKAPPQQMRESESVLLSPNESFATPPPDGGEGAPNKNWSEKDPNKDHHGWLGGGVLH